MADVPGVALSSSSLSFLKKSFLKITKHKLLNVGTLINSNINVFLVSRIGKGGNYVRMHVLYFGNVL